MADKKISEQVSSKVDLMRTFLFVPPRSEDFFTEIDKTLPSLPQYLSGSLEVFKQNTQSILNVLSLPFAMAQQSTASQHFQRLFIAERIRARNIDAEIGESDEQLELSRARSALPEANARMREFEQSDEGMERILLDIAETLLAYAPRSDEQPNASAAGSAELLRQGVVLTWTVFETSCRDIATTYINRHPIVALEFAKDPDIKRRIDTSKISLETLAKRDFNIQESLGDILFGEQELSDFLTIKAIFKCLSSDQMLAANLDNRVLWRLSQVRHLIVHRGGRVDKRYIEKTGHNAPLNTQIEVTRTHIEEYLAAV